MRKCREQWRGTAAHELLKCLGPEQFPSFFQNRFHVLHIIFTSFVTEQSNIFLSFALIQVLIVLSDFFKGYTFILLFPWPLHFDLRDAIPPVAYVPMVSSFLSIISDVTKEYSTWMVRKRKYRRYLDTNHWHFFNSKCSCTYCICWTLYIHYTGWPIIPQTADYIRCRFLLCYCTCDSL